MKAHNLKLDTMYFESVTTGIKNFEIRKNDRGYEKGDLLLLRRYKDGNYGRESFFTMNKFAVSSEENADTITAIITYVTDYAQQEGYVVLGIKLVSIIDREGNYEKY